MTIFNSSTGLYLSLIIRVSYSGSQDEPGLNLIHLSVQDGSLVHTVPLPAGSSKVAELDALDMEWCESGAEWPKDAVSQCSHVVMNR